MTAHVYHPPETAHLILKDECARCTEHAETPWQALDREKLDRLVAMALRWRYGDARCDEADVPTERPPDSEAEQLACSRIVSAVEHVTALVGARDGPEWFSRQRAEHWGREKFALG